MKPSSAGLPDDVSSAELIFSVVGTLATVFVAKFPDITSYISGAFRCIHILRLLMIIACFGVFVWHDAWFGGQSPSCFLHMAQSCGQKVLQFRDLDFQDSVVTGKVGNLGMARSFSTKWIVVCPLRLTVSFWTQRDSLLVSSGKFNCPSGDETICVASDGDEDRWGLTGVSPFPVNLQTFVFKDHAMTLA